MYYVYIMIKIGTIDNKLVHNRAEYLHKRLEDIGFESRLVHIDEGNKPILTQRDPSGKCLYVSILEDALREEIIDAAVYSMTDIPTGKVEGLQIAGLSERAAPEDVLLATDTSILEKGPLVLNKDIRIGTSSPRIKALLRHYFDEVQVSDISGEIPERISQLKAGQYDAVIFAKAELDRIGFKDDDISMRVLSPREFIPAPAQGVLAYQCRRSDKKTKKILAKVHQKDVAELTNVERSILRTLGGTYELPLGVFCEPKGNNFQAHAAYRNPEVDNGEMLIARAIHPGTFELANTILAQFQEEETVEYE